MNNAAKKLSVIHLFVFFAALSYISAAEISHSGSFDVENFPPEIYASDYHGHAGDLVQINYSISDPNGDNLKLNFSFPLNSSGIWNSSEEDTGEFYAAITVSDGLLSTDTTVMIALSPYCGDSTCDSSQGESCYNCQSDCRTCPSDTGSSGGGGGGVSRKKDMPKPAEPEQINKSLKEEKRFEISVKEIYEEMKQGEFASKKISIQNPKNSSVSIRAATSGELSSSFVLEKKIITVLPKSSSSFDLLMLADRPEGTYEGIIILSSSEKYENIPVTIKIIKAGQRSHHEILNMDVDLLTPTISPGKKLMFRLKMRKDPSLEKEPENVKLRYFITRLDPDSINYITGAAIKEIDNVSAKNPEIVYYEEEFSITDIASVPKEIEIPANFSQGEYILSVNAGFKGENFPFFTKFEVDVPWYEEKVFNVDKGSLALLTLALSLIWIISLVSRVRYFRDG